MREFFEWTSWAMEKPPAYGAFHLTFFFVGLAVCFLIAFLLRKTGEKGNRAVLLTCGIFLLLTEVYKQLFYYYVVNVNQHGVCGYQWWIFPFQLCSVPMYLCIIAPLLPKGKVQNAMYNFMLAFNLMSGFISFMEPSGLVHEYWTLTLHAFIWHMSLVFIGLYLGFSRRAALKKSDYKGAVITFTVCCTIAFILNCALWNVTGGSMNNFYIGPANSPIIVFKSFCEWFGWYVNTPIYIACLCIAAFVFFLPFYLYNKKHPIEDGSVKEFSAK